MSDDGSRFVTSSLFLVVSPVIEIASTVNFRAQKVSICACQVPHHELIHNWCDMSLFD